MRSALATRRSWLARAALAAAVIVAYGPALRAGFIWDDDGYVTENQTLLNLEGLAQIWLEPRSLPQYYPLVHTSYWIEYRLWRLEPAGYHAVNVSLHLLVALLLWRVLLRLGVPGPRLAAALFALHPVHVESVAWVTERKNVLSGLFYLSAALVYLRFDPPGDEDCRRNPWLYVGAALLFLLALLSKSVTATLPAALGVVYWWHRGTLSLRTAWPLLPLLLLGAASGLYTASLEVSQVGAAGAEWSLPLVERALVAGRAIVFYASKLILPWPLSFNYPRWAIDGSAPWQYAFPVAVLSLSLTLFLARKRIGRGPLAALLFFAVTLFPALGFLNVYPHRYSWVADHFQYLASIGPIALGAAGLALAARALPWPAQAAGLTLLLGTYAMLTFQQSGHYRDPETLWRATLAHNPSSFLAQSNLGNVLLRRGEIVEALPHYRAAVEIRPNDFVILNNLAWALATGPDAVRRPQEAVLLAGRAAAATKYGWAAGLDTLAAAYAGVGRFRDAVQTAERGIRVARLTEELEIEQELTARVGLYRRQTPYREPLGTRSKTSR